MTEPEPAANPQAQVTEEMVHAAVKVLRGNMDPKRPPDPRQHAPLSQRAEDCLVWNVAHSALTAALSLSRPAADRGQIVEECASVEVTIPKEQFQKMESNDYARGFLDGDRTVRAAIRALSPAPAQTEDKS